MKIVHHSSAYYELRRSPAVVADLERRGRALLQAAGGQGAGYAMSSEQGLKRPQGRWRVSVYTYRFEAIEDNARHNTLMRNLGAAK